MTGIIIYEFNNIFYPMEIGMGLCNEALYKSELSKLKSRGIEPYFAQSNIGMKGFRKAQETLPKIIFKLNKGEDVDVKKELSDCF